MTKKEREETFTLIAKMCEDVKRWVNHSKSGYRRSEETLEEFDVLWNTINMNVIDFELTVERTEFQEDFLNMIKYEGKLIRVHQKYDNKKLHFGIDETHHYVGWTKADKAADIYWFYDSSTGIVIESETALGEYGIDLNGFSEFVRKYFYPKYYLGTPAITGEMEVVYHLRYKNIKAIKENIYEGDDSKNE